MMGEPLTGSQKRGRGSAPKGRKSHTQFGLKREKTKKGRGRPRGRLAQGKQSDCSIVLMLVSFSL